MRYAIKLFFFFSINLSLSAYSQDQPGIEPDKPSDIEKFLSASGEMILVTDYKLTPINMGLSVEISEA